MKIFSFLLIIGFIILGIWSFLIEPNILKTRHICIQNKDLAGMKIVFASDFHIKPHEEYRLRKIVRRINDQNPDIILLGGDYVSGHIKRQSMPIKNIADGLKDLKASRGIYAVMGNHDGWQGKYEIIQEFKNIGVNVLENSNTNVDNLTIAGVEDLQTANPDIKKALTGAGKNIILLSHTPDVFPAVPENVSLTLTGHLHAGQVVLPNIPPKFVPSKYGTRYLYGLIYENGKTLYSTSGLGTSILPIRFNCLPEIVVIEFVI